MDVLCVLPFISHVHFLIYKKGFFLWSGMLNFTFRKVLLNVPPPPPSVLDRLIALLFFHILLLVQEEVQDYYTPSYISNSTLRFPPNWKGMVGWKPQNLQNRRRKCARER